MGEPSNPMSSTEKPTPSSFDALLTRAQKAYGHGRIDEALEIFSSAEGVARRHGDQALADRAFCNRSALLVQLERDDVDLPRLKAILLRSCEPIVRWQATYTVAMAYDLAGEPERSLPYARRAVELADDTGEPTRIAASANMLGLLAVRRSNFDEAEKAYGKAVELFDAAGQPHLLNLAVAEDNYGYVHLVTDRNDRGIELCESSRDRMHGLAVRDELIWPLQDLCFGYLQAERFDEAKKSGESALELALEIDEGPVVKNLLFLLGEISLRLGDRFSARRYLAELSRYYDDLPHAEHFVELLMTVDLTSVVNLRS